MFIAASLLLFLSIGFQLRMRRTKSLLTARLNERFAEREKIARELHDNLFQGVEGGLLLIHTATARVPMKTEQELELQNAFNRIEAVMASARSSIRNVPRLSLVWKKAPNRPVES